MTDVISRNIVMMISPSYSNLECCRITVASHRSGTQTNKTAQSWLVVSQDDLRRSSVQLTTDLEYAEHRHRAIIEI